MLFNFYLNEVLTDIVNLPLRCEQDGNKVTIFCYANDIALLTPTEKPLQHMLDMLAPKLENLSLKIKRENSCNTVFKHKSKRISTALTLQGQPLKQVNECVYPNIVLKLLMNNLACTSDVERSKRTFSKKQNSIYKQDVGAIQNTSELSVKYL